MNRFLAGSLTLSAMLLCVGLWIPLKAALAQELLELAWAESQARQTDTRPWPWADTWPVARLESAALDTSWVVLAGVHGQSLAFGPGQAAGTGERGPVIIAGHRDTHFSQLAEVASGDVFRLQNRFGEWRRYRVGSVRVVDSRKEAINLNTLPADRLLLVTCYPFNGLTSNGPLRYVVEAHLELPSAAVGEAPVLSIAGT